jgi:mRNA-degrading endonuclease RelE of RelBE toxin-antitoxin system
MKAVFLDDFNDTLLSAPPDVQRAFKKQLRFLLENIRHPSLRAKKYNEADDIWQARVTGAWRFYFTIANDAYIIIDVTSHPKT